MKLRMLPVAADRFVLLPIGIPLNVERSADGKVTGMKAAGQALPRDP